MSDVTPTVYQGVLMHDRRFTAAAISASLSSYTQAGMQAGVPVPAATTNLAVLEASGDPVVSTTIELETVAGGNPGTARMSWRYTGGARWYGWDPPTSISQFQFIDRTSTADFWKQAHMASRSDGYAWIVVQEGSRYVTCWRRAIGGTWTEATVYTGAAAVYTSPVHACPCIVVLPSGRLLCLFWVYTQVAIESCFSDDNGATWSEPQPCDDDVLNTLYATYSPSRIRAAYKSGQVLMIVSMTASGTDAILQFASSDQGATFSHVTPTAVLSNDAYPDVIATDSGFVFAALVNDGANAGKPYARRIGSAYQSIASSTEVLAQTAAATMTWGTIAAGEFTAGELAMCYDERGHIWMYGSDFNAAGGALREIKATVSYDDGVTWTSVTFGTPHQCQDVTEHPADFAVCAQGGRVLMASRFNSSGAGDDSLMLLCLGGPATVTMPQGKGGLAILSRVKGFSHNWLPFDLPENTGATWTFASAGAPTVGMTALGMRIQHGGVLSETTWTAVPVTTDTQGLHDLFDVRVVAGTATMDMRLATTYQIQVRVTPAAIVVRDMEGATTTLATVSTTVGATGVQIKMALGDDVGGAGNNGKMQCWYRATGDGANRDWFLAWSSTTIRQAAATADRIEFGTPAGDATTDVYFRSAFFAMGSETGANYYNGLDQEDMLGQSLSGSPAALGETGVRLAMTTGPTIAGEVWSLPVAYGYPITRIDPVSSPSPAKKWRTTGETEQSIVWELTDATSMQSPFTGVGIAGANFGTCILESWDGASWDTEGTIDLRIGTGLRFTRVGAIVTCDPSGGSSVTDFLPANVLANATWKTGAGGILRRIRTNSAGRWSTTATAGTILRPTIALDTYDAGDASSGSSGELWSTHAVTLFRGLTTTAARWRIRIPAQDTAEGYFECGTIMIGPVQVFAKRTSRGRQVATQTNVETTEQRSGARAAVRRGAARRSEQVAWAEGAVDASDAHNTSPNYVRSYTSGDIIAMPAATPTDLLGLLTVNDTVPIWYLSKVTVPATGAVVNMTARDVVLYGRIVTDTIQVDTILGEAWTGSGAGELVRVGTLRVEEEL